MSQKFDSSNSSSLNNSKYIHITEKIFLRGCVCAFYQQNSQITRKCSLESVAVFKIKTNINTDPNYNRNTTISGFFSCQNTEFIDDLFQLIAPLALKNVSEYQMNDALSIIMISKMQKKNHNPVDKTQMSKLIGRFNCVHICRHRRETHTSTKNLFLISENSLQRLEISQQDTQKNLRIRIWITDNHFHSFV